MQTNLDSVLAALREKSAYQSSQHRIWLVGGSGSLNGAYLAGVQIALVEAGLQNVFDGVIGVSTSIPALGYMLATGSVDQMRLEATMYAHEARSRKFLKSNGTMDIPWLITVLKGATGKPIQYERLRASGVRFVGVATDWETGLPQYIEPTTEDEFYSLVAAGCSIPTATDPVLLRGRLMTDGAVSDPCPVSWLMSLPEAERPTHILIIANAWYTPPTSIMQKSERFLWKLLFSRSIPACIIEGFANRLERFNNQVMAAVNRKDVLVAVDWLPWPQRTLDRDSKKIAALTEAGYERFKVLLMENGNK